MALPQFPAHGDAPTLAPHTLTSVVTSSDANPSTLPHPPSVAADEYLNPNYKETLPREWWNTSFQLLPTDDILAKIKSNDPTYTTLDGSCRQMQGSRIEVIAECCKGNTSITEIDLRGNGFDADGLYALVQALKTMPNVKKLNLRGNTCRNEGIEALADLLKVREV